VVGPSAGSSDVTTVQAGASSSCTSCGLVARSVNVMKVDGPLMTAESVPIQHPVKNRLWQSSLYEKPSSMQISERSSSWERPR
jgi:hypothetical protein